MNCTATALKRSEPFKILPAPSMICNSMDYTYICPDECWTNMIMHLKGEKKSSIHARHKFNVKTRYKNTIGTVLIYGRLKGTVSFEI